MDFSDVRRQLELLSLAGDPSSLAAVLEQESVPIDTVAETLRNVAEKTTSLAQLQCVQMLLEKTDSLPSDSLSVLLIPASRLSLESLVSALLSRGCNANIRDVNRKTPLMHALESPSVEASTICQELIVHGADAAATDIHGNSPLHFAAESGHVRAVQILIESRAPLMSRNEVGDTPLHVAVRRRCRDVAIRLVSAGANPYQENNSGESPFSERESDTKLTNELLREYAKAQRLEPVSQYRPKKPENGQRNKKNSVWKQVQRPVTVSKPQEEAKPTAGEWKQLQEEVERLRSAKAEVESRLHSLQYLLEQRSGELDSLKQKVDAYHGSFLFPVTPSPVAGDKLQSSLQTDMQRYLKDVEAWQDVATPLFEALISDIHLIVKHFWPDSDLSVFGSFANKLHLPSSDLDLVIGGSKLEAVSSLARLEAEFRRDKRVLSTNLISMAFIPILKVHMQVQQLKVMVDISIEQPNHSGKSCNSLLLTYLTRYKVLRPVLLVLKQVLYQFEFHEPFKGGLGSYGLALMTVFAFQSKGPAWEAIVCTNNSQMSLALMEVLKYYALTFQFLTPICPKDSSLPVSKSLPDFCATESPYLIITDPLNEENNVGRNTNLPRLQGIFKTCYKCLQRPTPYSGNVLLRMLNEAKYFWPEER